MVNLETILQMLMPALAGGGLGWLAKSNRRKAAAEADAAEARADNDEWQVHKDQIAHLSELCKAQTDHIRELTEQHAHERSEMEERFRNQTDRLREVQRALAKANDEIVKQIRECGRLMRLVEHFKNWHCRRDYADCERREPEQRLKTKYCPIDEEEADESGGQAGCDSGCSPHTAYDGVIWKKLTTDKKNITVDKKEETKI